MIAMTAKQLLMAIICLLGGIYLIGQFLFGGVKSDITDIRAALTETQDRNADTHQTSTTADAELRAQLASLTAELRVTNNGLATLTNSVGKLDERLQSIETRLADSVTRQSNFERWVVTRLGSGPIPSTVPAEWKKVEGDILDTLTSGNDPLSLWYKATIEQQQ